MHNALDPSAMGAAYIVTGCAICSMSSGWLHLGKEEQVLPT